MVEIYCVLEGGGSTFLEENSRRRGGKFLISENIYFGRLKIWKRLKGKVRGKDGIMYDLLKHIDSSFLLVVVSISFLAVVIFNNQITILIMRVLVLNFGRKKIGAG